MRDIIIRAVKTFAQAFLSVLSLGLANVVDLSSGKALLIAAVAAGISALQNFVRDTL